MKIAKAGFEQGENQLVQATPMEGIDAVLNESDNNSGI